MNTTELRIGNWVYSIAGGLRGGYGKVRGIEGEGALIMLARGHLKPIASDLLCWIPLTLDIIQKCGFEEKHGFYWWGHHGFHLEFDGHDWCVCPLADESFVITYIKHLHQLQNIYLLVMGKELKIEL